MSTNFGLELDGQVAIVTGVSSEIGGATAESLASRGASVVLADRREDELEELAARIKGGDGQALVVATDITDDDDIDNVVETTIDVNLSGLIKLTHAVISTMREQESGHIVNPLLCCRTIPPAEQCPLQRDKSGRPDVR